MATLRHVTMVAKFLDLNRPWSCKYGRKKDKIDTDFPVHDCTKEQNCSGYFSPIGRQCKWPPLSKKDCWVPGIMLPWKPDVTPLFTVEIVRKRRNTPTLMYHGAYDRLNFRIRMHRQIVTNLYLRGFRSDWNDTECYMYIVSVRLNW